MTPHAPFHTLRWTSRDTLEILDQRRLPGAEVYCDLHTAEATAEAIRTLAVRGAPAIGCAAAYGIALAALRSASLATADFDTALEAAFGILAASRPTAVNLFWALGRMQQVRDLSLQRGEPPGQCAHTLLAAAHRITEDDIAANLRMGALGAALVPEDARVLTHCNAGALATAGHGTALGVIRSAVAVGKRVSVFADETRPVLQGARLTAWELGRDGIPVTLLPDGAAGHLMATTRIDLVIVGADRIAANGDVANKIGTYAVAVLARRHGIPFYVAAPRSTFDLALQDGRSIPIEERDPAEVTGAGESLRAPAGVAVFNPAFDVTPAELVTAIITEAQIIYAPDTARIHAAFERE